MPMLTRLKKQGERAAFAKKLGVSDQVLSNWKRRGLPAGKVAQVAAALGITYEQYMHEAGRPLNVLQQDRAQYTEGYRKWERDIEADRLRLIIKGERK